MRIQIINGPNLNLLGTREPDIYGNTGFETYFATLQKEYTDCHLDYFQSNHEGEIIDKIHEAGFSYDGIVLNAGGYTHTSVAILDAIKSVITPVIEVHISNIHTREEFRHKSLIAAGCKGSVIGLGLYSYNAAIDFFRKNKQNK